jgi:hypothetical protein
MVGVELEGGNVHVDVGLEYGHAFLEGLHVSMALLM